LGFSIYTSSNAKILSVFVRKKSSPAELAILLESVVPPITEILAKPLAKIAPPLTFARLLFRTQLSIVM
jgi:hypothetical protein